MDNAEQTIKQFLADFWRDRVWQISQTVVGAEVCVRSHASHSAGLPYIPGPDDLYHGPAGQEWQLMARAVAGELERNEWAAGEVYETCQKWAEWLFASPGAYSYQIPDHWYESPAGAIWAAALVWSQGDELVTIKEAADLLGVSSQTISTRISRGSLRGFVDPSAPGRQGRRLVRRSDVLALREE